jgi:hypothetical protein
MSCAVVKHQSYLRSHKLRNDSDASTFKFKPANSPGNNLGRGKCGSRGSNPNVQDDARDAVDNPQLFELTAVAALPTSSREPLCSGSSSFVGQDANTATLPLGYGKLPANNLKFEFVSRCGAAKLDPLCSQFLMVPGVDLRRHGLNIYCQLSLFQLALLLTV